MSGSSISGHFVDNFDTEILPRRFREGILESNKKGKKKNQNKDNPNLDEDSILLQVLPGETFPEYNKRIKKIFNLDNETIGSTPSLISNNPLFDISGRPLRNSPLAKRAAKERKSRKKKRKIFCNTTNENK